MNMETMYDFLEKNQSTGRNGGTQRQAGVYDPDEYRERKQAERQELFDMLKEATKEAVSSDEAFNQYIHLQARLNYTVSNSLLVFLQKPDAAELREFDDWKARGAHIRKNSKAIKILEPHIARNREGEAFTAFQTKRVLDISQTTALPENRRREEVSDKVKFFAIMGISKAKVEAVETHTFGDDVFYDGKQNTIYLRKGLEREAFLKGLIREEVKAAVFEQNKEELPEIQNFQAACATYLIRREYGLADKDMRISVPESLKNMEPKEIRRCLEYPVSIHSKLKEMQKQIATKVNEKQSRTQDAR